MADDQVTRIANLQTDARRVDGTLNDAPGEQKVGTDRWTDGHARRVAVQEYDEASKWRKSNHDWRWDEAEKLYLAYYPQLTWPGSRQPRSSLGVPITFEQIEAMKPRMISAMFNEDQWFELEAKYGVEAKIAAHIQNTIYDQFCYSSPREQIRRSVGSALLLGNGIIELYWDRRKLTREEYIPQWIEKRRRVVDPITGRWYNTPTGERDFKMVTKQIEEYVNRPAFRNVSCRDIFIDPHAPSPVPKESRYVHKRVMMTLDDILSLKDANGFDVPDEATLVAMLNYFAEQDVSDQSRQNANAMRGVALNPNCEYTADGRIARVEVLIRWSADRLIWVLGKSIVIYNHPNPYGFGRIPYYNIFYADLVDRFYGLSIADVVEGEQRFQQRLINARLDELSLAMEPPTVTTGGRLSTFELRYRPGNVVQLNDVNAEVQRQFPQGFTNQAYQEQQQSDIRVQRITGQNESIMQGVPTAQNPIGRSATGANMQAAASMARIIYIVENIESLVLEPMILDAWELDKKFMSPEEMQETAKAGDVDVAEMFNARVVPHVRAGSKMMSKQMLAQQFPLLLQSLSNGPVLQQLAQQGLTVDWSEMFRVLFDATGYARKATIIRPMNQEEQQAMQQAQEQQNSGEQMKMQLQRERFEQLSEMQYDKGTMDFVRDIAKMLVQQRGQQGQGQGQGQGGQNGQPGPAQIQKFLRNGR